MFWIILACIVALFVIILARNDPLPIYGVYRQPGKWYTLKYWIFYMILRHRKRSTKNRPEAILGKDAGYGTKSRSSEKDMECVQNLSLEHPLAVDAVYFNGGSPSGQYFVGATARRHNGIVQTLLYIRIPDIGLLELPSFPDTTLTGDKEMSFSAGGLCIEVVEPMKKWQLSFNGKMRLMKSATADGATESESARLVYVSFDVEWNALTGYFDFDVDLHPNVLCDAAAREPWTRKFFNNLRAAHQTHYEQFGKLTGAVNIAEYGQVELNVTGMRDHSYGNVRDWCDLHRYALQFASLIDGTSICVGNICMPRTMSRLIVGYVFHPDGSMYAVSDCDLQLDLVGDDGNDPVYCKFNFIAGHVPYCMEVHVLERPIFYMGNDRESRIHERMCKYVVNGERVGYGISEWCYRNVKGKLDDYNARLSFSRPADVSS